MILIQGQSQLGIQGDVVQNMPKKQSWAVVLRVFESMVKAIRQDGSTDLFNKLDFKTQVGTFPYSVGNPVYYDLHGEAADLKTGVLTDISRKAGTEDIETFTLKDDVSGDIIVHPKSNVLIRMALPEGKVDFDSNYNSVPIAGRTPGLIFPDAKP
jgi:hypothetical protein